MSIAGPADGGPFRLPVAISDINGGLYGALGVLAALQARERTGRGQWVETSLYEAALSLAVYEAAGWTASMGLLALGPVVGVAAMARLRHCEEASAMAGGRR